MTAGDEDLTVLRAKYHDWCSARVADRFLALSPEQIYAIAHGRSAGDGGGASAFPDETDASAPNEAAEVPAFGDLSYQELVERVSLELSREMGLPEFDAWLEQYRRDPERFEAEMMGFWRGSDGG